MSLILKAIGKQRFELVRDRIGLIIADELVSQKALINDPEQLDDVAVWIERIIPFGIEELTAINVGLFRGVYGEKNVESVRGVYDYFVDFHVEAASKSKTPGEQGDQLAQVKIQRLAGIVRAILESPFYLRLLFSTKPIFIERVKVMSLQIGEQKSDGDGGNISSARMMFQVTMEETAEAIEPFEVTGFDTTVQLSSTPLGFLYISDDP